MTAVLSDHFAALDAENEPARLAFDRETAHADAELDRAAAQRAEARRLAAIEHRRYIGRVSTFATQLRDLADQLVTMAEPADNVSCAGHVVAAGTVIGALTTTTAPMFTALMELAGQADEARRAVRAAQFGGAA